MVKGYCITLIVTLGLAGCTTFIPPTPDDPSFAPKYPKMEKAKPIENGSLFNASTNTLLFEDFKALQVGDIITVNLSEATNATKQADTEIIRQSQVQLPDPIIFGRNPRFDDREKSAELDILGNNRFIGEADSEQRNILNGTITVTVHEVLPNGNLYIRGEKWMTLNYGDEFIRLSGIVRPQDVTADNTVLSSRVANARIQYSGTGAHADANKQGFLSRFFNSPWWPF